MAKKSNNTTLVKEALNLTAARFKALIENAYDGIVLYDANGVIQYASPSIKNFGGYTPHDLLGKKGSDFVFHEDIPASREAFFKVLLAPGKSVTEVQRFVDKKGNLMWAEYTLTNLLHNPEVRGIVSNFRDIHKGRIAEEEASRSKYLLNKISENIVDGIFFGIPGEEFQYVNKGFLDISGYKSLEELKKIKPHFLFAEVGRWNEINALLEKKQSVKNEQALLRKKNGDFLWGSVSISLFEDRGKLCFVGSVQDITRHKEAEAELSRSQQLLSAISNNIHEGMFRSDGEKFLFVSDGFARMFGYSNGAEVLKKHPQSFYVSLQDRSKIINVLKKEHTVSREVEFKRKNGSKFWGLESINYIKDGARFLMDGTVRNITQQKEAEKQLNESRNFLDNVMKTVAAPIFVKDSKHRWIMFNDAFCWFMDKTRKELMGKTEKDFLIQEETRVSWKVDKQVLETGDVVINREKITLKNKVKHLLTVKSRYINDDGEKFVIGFITDITEIKKREAEISALNANLLGVMESTHESIYAVDKDLNYIAFNKHHAQMARVIYGVDVAVGQSVVAYLKGTPESRWLRKELGRALKGEHFATEQCVSQPRYKEKFVETRYNPIYDKKNKVTGAAVFVRDITDFKLAQQAISQSNATLTGVIESTTDRIVAVDKNFRYLMFNKSHAIRMKRLTGKEIQIGEDFIKMLPREIASRARKQLSQAFKGEQSTLEFELAGQHLEASLNPIKDSASKVIGATLFVRDVSARKQFEEKLRTLNEGLTSQNWQLAAQEEELKATLEELSERNFELDQLMYKTSHDLRSPLSSILGLVHLANLDGNKENHIDYLNKIEDRIKKLDEFIKSMLNYARVNRSEVVYEDIDLDEIVESCVQELQYLENFAAVKVRIAVTKNVKFKSDPLRIKIIFANVISNAYKYYNPTVKSYLKINAQVTNEKVEIDFQDNGIGIKKEYLDRIFDMFYRATEKSQGSGLGMYIVKQAVDKLKGSIKAKSVYGTGTTINITLPNN
jgi:PAS domain S-box-containing protein